MQTSPLVIVINTVIFIQPHILSCSPTGSQQQSLT